MLCSRCNATSPDGNRYCDVCGAPLQSACPFCGHSNRSDARFCGGCGRALTRDEAASGPSEVSSPVTAPSLPAPLAALLRSRFAREGERKQVTVLFADIRDSTELIGELDPEQALHRLEPGLQTMVKAVHQYGGTVCRIQGDGIMALFGAPLAFEDHAVRACFAARAMIDYVARLGEDYVDIRVGLNSGEVVVRSIGHDLSMDYDAVGPTTHLASRMEHLAMPSTVCMTRRTAQLAGGFIQVRSRGFETIKGISRPVEVFELIGAAGQSRWQVRAAAHNLSPFVGRQTEMQVLLEALQRSRVGRGQIVAIAGEAGVGKSRLVHEFLQDASIGGEFSLCSAAMPHDQNTPYQLVAGLIRSWLRVETDDTQAEIDEKLTGAIVSFHPDHTADLTPLRSLLDLPVQDNAWERLDAVRRRRRTHEVVRSLVLRAARSAPSVLVIEDVHWADFESQSILESIIDGLGAAHLLVIATYRPEYQHQWARHSYYSLVQLRALDGDSSDTLLRSLLGDSTDLASLRQRMIDQTDGTPLFLEEMARTLVEAGVLVSEPTRFRLTRSVEEIEIPDSVQSVLASRIDRLPSEERSLLQIASVIGKDVPVALLRAVADVPADQLARQLLELRTLEFLYEVNGPSDAEYTFKHALTHAVAYDSMLLRHRRALHGRVLTAIEEHFTERIDEFTERLADHAVRGEVWDKAAGYCYKAGQRANGLSVHHAARVFFERALDAVGRLPMSRRVVQQAIEIRLGLRVALLATADLEQVRKYLQEAESLARSIDDERRLMPIVISRSTILYNLGDLHGAIEAGLQGRALAERMNDETSFISSGFALGQAYWNRGDFGKAEDILSGTVRALTADLRKRYAGTTGTASVLSLVSLSHTHCLVGHWEQAFARSREALEIAMETEKPYDLSYAHGAQGLAHLTVGEFEAAIHHLEEALKIAQAGEIMLLIPHAARYLGRAYALSGRLDEAQALLSSAVEQAKSQSLAALHGWCAAALGLTLMLSGASNEAERLVRNASEFARSQDYRPLEVHTSRLLGMINTRASADTDAASRAERWFRAAISLAAELGMEPELAHCHEGLADLLMRTGRCAEARGEFAAALELYRVDGMKGDAARVAAALVGAAGQVPSSLAARSAVTGRRIVQPN